MRKFDVPIDAVKLQFSHVMVDDDTAEIFVEDESFTKEHESKYKFAFAVNEIVDVAVDVKLIP